MSDTADYGSALNAPIVSGSAPSNPAAPPPGSPTSLAPPPPNPGPQAPVPDPTTQAAPAAQSMTFGGALRTILGAPNYTPPDPKLSALDQTADTLNQRVQRANDVATNPLAQIFNPEAVQRARDFVPKATEQLQQIQKQKADIAANVQQGMTLGLHPGDVSDQASQADRVEVAKARALTGDLRVFKGLQAVDPKTAEAIQDQVYEVVGSHIDNAQLAYDKLSNVRSQGEYSAAVSSLRKDGTITQLEALGLKVPDQFEAFSAAKAGEGQALREARIGIQNVQQKLEERNTYLPMEEKEAKTYTGRITTAYGDQVTNGSWSRNGASGTRGLVVNGAADPRDLGKTFTLATPEQRDAIKKEFDGAVPKEDIEKYRANNRTYQLATTDNQGKKLADGVINTNPNVQQGIAEGLAAMLRGGQGGANVGLLKIETSKRGAVQGFLDSLISNYAGGVNTLTGDQVRPYLSKLTQSQQRDVLDMLKGYNDSNISDRTAPIAQRAGALGLDSAALGLGDKESAGAVADAIERGRQAQVARMSPYHQAIGDGDGVLQIGAQRPGAGAVPLNPGAQPTNQLPGAQPLQTPVQQATVPPAPPSSGGGNPPGATQPPAPAPGGGQPSAPTTIAGQPVNFTPPPGASPNFLPALQRIESGNEKNPWQSGTPGSSASGAFQFINSTWAANKPPGAPDRAADATPAQQTQALEKLTATNAAHLQVAGVPVNDTNLYIAHNVGAGGASALLHADMKADARSIVGEAAAKNNPLFFKGRPTVATVLARYQAEMNGSLDDTVPKPKPGAGGATASLPDVGAAPWNGATTPAGDTLATPEQRANSPVVNNAPAIGSTVGAIAGAAGGGIGAMAGGGAGGAAGQSFKDYMQGRDQDPKAIAKQGALGAVLGIAPEARPLLGAAARVAGVAGVDAGMTAAEGGNTADVIGSGVEGGAYALGGEALGRFVSALGPAAHKVISNYLPSAQKELSTMAGKLSEARKVLETEQPKLAGDGAGANPKYEAAKNTEEAATKFIKDHNQNPDDMVYAYDQAKNNVSAGEALTMRPAAKEKTEVGAGYNDLRQQVSDAGVGAPKPNQPVPDGPVSQLRTADNPTGKVPEQFRAEAEHAEMLIKAPAPNFGAKWQQLQNAGSELIQKRMAFLANADRPSADAMDNLFQGVRNQQKAVANYVFGPERGPKIISNLENLDTRYAKVMNATKGMDYEKMKSTLAQGNTPEARELTKNFTEFAKGDPSAIRAFNAMKAGAKGDWKSEANLMGPVIMGEVAANMSGVPTVGAISALVGGHRLYKLVQGYMNARILGKAVTFKDFLASEIKKGSGQTAAAIAQRGAVQQSAPQPQQ